MAATYRAFSAIPLNRMEYHHPDSYLQRTNLSTIVQSPFLGTSASQLHEINHMPMGSELNSDGVCFNANSPFHLSPVVGGECTGMFLGSALPIQNTDRTQVTAQTCAGLTGRMRKKHRHDQLDDACASKRRKLSASPVIEQCHVPDSYSKDSPQCYWNASNSQAMPVPAPVVPAPCGQPSEMHTIPTEDMEESTIESHSDSALRRIRDIEDRLAEEEDEHNTDKHLPKLVMSEVLLESLKKGLDESLTKKIMDSINRPSMELVLWKPQPEFLIDKLHNFADSCKAKPKVSKRAQKASETTFLQQEEPLEEDHPQILTADCGIDPMWGREDEEMEL